MKIFKFTLLIGLLAILSIQSCKKNYGTPPDLPPMTSFITDFSDFDSNKAVGDSTNWKFAATNVGIWNFIITVGLAVPVASYIEAVNNHTPIYLSDNTWLWEYSFTDILGTTYTAKLYGILYSEYVDWEMYISKENVYVDFLWYTGTSLTDGTKVDWILHEGPNKSGELLSIKYNKTSDNTGNIKYMNIVPGGAENGGYIMYGNDSETALNAYYYIYNKGQDNLTEIEWNQTVKNGRVKEFKHFQDNEWHCWDEKLQDAVCE